MIMQFYTAIPMTCPLLVLMLDSGPVVMTEEMDVLVLSMVNCAFETPDHMTRTRFCEAGIRLSLLLSATSRTREFVDVISVTELWDMSSVWSVLIDTLEMRLQLVTSRCVRLLKLAGTDDTFVDCSLRTASAEL